MEISASSNRVDSPFRTQNTANAANTESANPAVAAEAPISTMQDLKQAELQGEKVPPGKEQLIKALDHFFKTLDGNSTYLQYSVHEPTNSIIFKVVDKDTGDVLKEIPSHKILDMVTKLSELVGLIVDKRA